MPGQISKKAITLSKHIYNSNRVNDVNTTLLTNGTGAAGATAATESKNVSIAPPSVFTGGIPAAELTGISSVANSAANVANFAVSEVSHIKENIKELNSKIDSIGLTPPPTIHGTISTNYTITSNTLDIVHSPSSSIFFFPLGINTINIINIDNIPNDGNFIYKYTFYIKKQPFEANYYYIQTNAVNIISNGSPVTTIQLAGGNMSKPGINSTYIIQEITLFCYYYRWSGFQTISEI